MRRSDIQAILIATATTLAASAAAAQEYCVACAEPEAVYRCVIDGAQPGGAQPLQMLCITAMAKAGGHATCGVKRGTVFQCEGPVKRVPWTAAGDETPAPIATPVPAARPADPSAPPTTVLEMADRANRKTAADMKKAGENVKEGAQNLGQGIATGAKKTWECLASLFFKC